MASRPRSGLDALAVQVAPTDLGRVEYCVLGDGAPVLVLHGSPGGIDQAEAMSRFLPRDHIRSILLSRPGYLGTPLPDRPGIDTEADLLAGLLDHLGIARAGVLAWSGGGPSAYRLAARHPERVTAIVAVAAVSKRIVVPDNDLTTRLLFTTRVGEWLLGSLAAVAPKQLISGTLSSEGSLPPAVLRERTEEIFADETRRRFVLDLATTASQRGPRRAGWLNDRAQFAAIDSLDLPAAAAPVLLVHGSVDTDVPPDHSVDAHAALPDSELLTLDVGTHLAFFTHPDAAAAQHRAIDVLTTGRLS